MSGQCLLSVGVGCPALEQLHLTTEYMTDCDTLQQNNARGSKLYARLQTIVMHVYAEEELPGVCFYVCVFVMLRTQDNSHCYDAFTDTI